MEDRKQIPMLAEESKPKRIRRTERYKDQYTQRTSLEQQAKPQTQNEPKPRSPVYTAEREIRRPVDAIYYCPPGYNPEQRNISKKAEERKKEKKKRARRRVIASILAAGALVGWTWSSNSEKKEENIPTPTPIATTVPTPTRTPEQFRMELAVTPTQGANVQEANCSDISAHIARTISLIPTRVQRDDAIPMESWEKEFFNKYSSTFNPSIQGNDSGPFTSIEEMLEAYESDPERFARYGKAFMQSIEIDYIKMILARKYGVRPSDMAISYNTYREGHDITGSPPLRGECYEVEVENLSGKNFEMPAFVAVEIIGSEAKTVRIVQGSRGSKIDMHYWENFFEIWRLEGFNPKRHDVETYNEEAMHLFIEHMQPMFEELSPRANPFSHWEEER